VETDKPLVLGDEYATRLGLLFSHIVFLGLIGLFNYSIVYLRSA